MCVCVCVCVCVLKVMSRMLNDAGVEVYQFAFKPDLLDFHCFLDFRYCILPWSLVFCISRFGLTLDASAL